MTAYLNGAAYSDGKDCSVLRSSAPDSQDILYYVNAGTAFGQKSTSSKMALHMAFSAL
jgi:hypothetical protein